MKRTSKELKRIARDILNDRYRVPMAAFAATTLIATVIESPFSFSMGDNPTNMQLVISLIAELLISVVSFVLGCGVAKIHLSMTRGNDFRVRDIFDPFKKNTDRFFIAGFLFLLMIFVSMIPVIGGFTYAVIADFSVVSIVIAAATGILSLILSCYFMLTYHFIGYITLDHPELKCLEVFKECRLLMHGNRLRLLYSAQFYRIWLIGSLFLWHRIPLGRSISDRNTRYFLSRLHRRIEPDPGTQL